MARIPYPDLTHASEDVRAMAASLPPLNIFRMLPHVLRVRRAMWSSRRRGDLEVLRAGPFPFNKALALSAPERAAQRVLDLIATLNWRLAGGRTP